MNTVERNRNKLALLRELRSHSWAIHPDALEMIARALVGTDVAFAAPEPRAARRMQVSSGQGGAVAVLPISGPISPRASFFSYFFGGTSVESFRDMLAQALGDPGIGAIVLDIDSPGGQVDLVPELAADIAAAGKPIVAVANTDAASAAYWLATQADELFVTPSGEIGSIGCYCMHSDWSVYDEKLGVKTTLIFAGTYKVDGNPFEPLSDSARESMQGTVDTYYDMFVAAVASGRGAKLKSVIDGFGQGRMVLAKDAVAEGMADRVGTLEDAVARAAELAGSVTGTAKADKVPPGTPSTSRASDVDPDEDEPDPDVDPDEAEPDVDPDEEPADAPTSSQMVPGAERLLARSKVRELLRPA